MLKKIMGSLRYKAFAVLVFFTVVPLLILGITTNIVAKGIIQRNINHLSEQTIDRLSLNISRDLQWLYDLTYNCSKNSTILNAISKPVNSDAARQQVYKVIFREIKQKQLINRFNYPFHYILVTKAGEVYTDYTYSPNANYFNVAKTISSENWFKNLNNSYSYLSWIGTRPHYLFPDGEEQIYIACNMVHNIENNGVILVGINKNYIAKMLGNAKLNNSSNIFLVQEAQESFIEGYGNTVAYEKLSAMELNQVKNRSSRKNEMIISGEKQLVLQKSLLFKEAGDAWDIVMLTPVRDIYSDISKINYITVILVLLSTVSIILLVLLINRNIVKPVVELSSLMYKVREGNLDVKASEFQNDEIGQLGSGFNNMVFNLKKYINKIQEEEKEKRELEIKMLQSQIKPHFVRNTLNTIRWMAEMKKASGISHAITSFTKLLDYNFNDANTLTTVQEEIDYLSEYIYLQRLRYQNKFTSSINISPDILKMKILKLLFQPIVENSITHGLSRKEGFGHIDIKGYIDQKNMVFEISDNGVGIQGDILQKVLSEDLSSLNGWGISGIGLANIQKRIRLNFGDNYGISIESIYGEGTKITIRLPLLEDNEQEGVQKDENINC